MLKQQTLLSLLIVGSLATAGCGNRTARPSGHEMAGSAQERVHAFFEQDGRQAEQHLALLLESLEAYARDYRGDFVPLHESAEQLLQLYRDQAPAEQIAQLREELEHRANALAP